MQRHSTQKKNSDRLFGWWYAIAAPPDVSKDAPLRERTFVRRSRFTSIILLIEIIYHVLYLLAVFRYDSDAIPPISITIACFVAGVILNRFGKQRTANFIAYVAIELSMIFYFISQTFGAGGFSFSLFSIISILVSPDIIAISLFPIWVALSLSTLNCLFVVVALAFFPKAPDMIQQLAELGSLLYYQGVSIQAVVIAVSLFWVRNTTGEMARANQAEEVNKLVQALAIQQQAALQEKRQLEECIQQIVAVHTQVANGNLNARVPLDQKNVLWSIAGSLNNLLARFQRWRQEAQKLQHVERSLQKTLYDIQRAKAQGVPLRLQKTGTIVDTLIAELTGDRSFYYSSHHGSSTVTPRSESFDNKPYPEQKL